jgi:hypothetical protein
MNDTYEPTSDFLKAIVAETVPLSGGVLANANLDRLIAMTRDDDLSNRDWATMLLAQLDQDTPTIRSALLAAVRDRDAGVSAEALLGLARRDRQLALPHAIATLCGEQACMAVFEAAEIIADRSLVEYLVPWTEPSGDEWLDDLARAALTACQQASPA